MLDKECPDVTIIGGGPAGLYAAFYSGLRELKTKIIEYQSRLGGKIHLYPEKMIWDVGGLPPLTGAQLIRQLEKQGTTFQPEVVLNEKVESMEKNQENLFLLKGSSGSIHCSKTVIIAAGGGILKPQKLEVEGAERFELFNLHYAVPSFKRFKDKVVMISGGGDAAIDLANELEPIAKKVYLSYRKEHLKGHESQVNQLLGSSVECFFQTSITKLVSENTKWIKKVELTNHHTGETVQVMVDEVMINHGFERDASLLENSDLDIELMDDFFIAGNGMSESNIDGLYAAGDILKHEGKLHLIAGAFQDGANAVNSVKKYLDPSSSKMGMVSSHNDRLEARSRTLIQEMLRG